MKLRRRSSVAGLCVYCSQRDAVTYDHVPPKSLFGKPRPRLVTVPSCLQCNLGASKDDEYFRTMIAFRHDLDHPDASAAFDAAMRSLARPRAGGMRTALLNGLREVDVRSPAGLYLGRAGSYDVDVDRLDRVVRRTMLGLFYREIGRPLPRHYNARAFLLSQISPSGRAQIAAIVNTVQGARAPSFVGRRVLSYWWQRATDEPHASAWLLVFYERVAWLGITMPPTTRA
jgi:hypothetical protein